MAFEELFLGVKDPAVGGDTDIHGLDNLVVGDQLCGMIAGFVVDIGESIILFIDAYAAISVPGLLDEEAVGGHAVDVIMKDHGVREIVACDFGYGKMGFIQVGQGRVVDELYGEEGKGGEQDERDGKEYVRPVFFWQAHRALGDAEGLPVRVVEELGEGVEGSDLWEAGELSVEQSFDRGQADQDPGAGFDGVGEGLQITLDQSGGIGEAGFFT